MNDSSHCLRLHATLVLSFKFIFTSGILYSYNFTGHVTEKNAYSALFLIAQFEFQSIAVLADDLSGYVSPPLSGCMSFLSLEKPGVLQSMGSQNVGHDLVTKEHHH